MVETDWWKEEAGFFGDFYIEGDNSVDGYLLNKKQNLDQRTATEVEGIINLLNLKPGDKILDMPCGYGRHSKALAKMGMKVTGVDINQKELNLAKQNSEDLALLNLKFEKEDMREFKRLEEFDAAINMFYSFGFFASDEENLNVLQNFYYCLKPNGKFLMHTDVNLPRILDGKYKTHEFRRLSSGGLLEIIDQYDVRTKRINGVWKISRPEIQTKEKSYSVRVYTKEEFEDLCKKVGFKTVNTVGDWSNKAYSIDSEDMIIIAQK